MKSGSELIVDQNGIEILVDYRYEKSDSFEAEEGNPGSEVQALVYTELKSVEVIIKGRGIDILPLLHENEKEFIIDQLTYES